MVAQFQSLMTSIYNGWVLFACLAYSFAVFPSMAMKLGSLRKTGLLRTSCWLAILTSLYVLLNGFRMAFNWVDPFAGKEGEMTHAIHNPKAWLIVGVIVVWPYVLIAIGGLIGYLAIRDLRRIRVA